MRAGESGGAVQGDPAVIHWQGTARVALAVLLGGTAAALIAAGVLPGAVPTLLAAVAAYVAFVLLVRAWVARRRAAGPAVAAAVVVGDLAAVFVCVVSSSPPQYYEQILLLAFVVLHFAEFAFGARVAACSVAATAAVFLLVARWEIGRGAALIWEEELWSAGVYVIASGTFLFLYGDLERRLARLSSLFEHAAAGDYSGEYDVSADRRPDAITAVGRAYNHFRAQLTSLVLEDPLSGCYNRRGFQQLLGAELARAARTGSEVALLAVDVDHFKRINDERGHLAGDQVIRETGQLLRATARTHDVVARTGGEEFLILAPETGEEGARHLADRVVAAFRAGRFGGGDGDLAITVSVGLVSDRVSGSAHAEDLLARADEALYAAKRAGRDRVVVWRPAVRAAERARRLG